MAVEVGAAVPSPRSDLPAGLDPMIGQMLGPGATVARSGSGEGALTMASSAAGDVAGSGGWARGATLRRGFSVVMADTVSRRAIGRDFVSGEELKLHCKLDGSSLVSSGGEESVSGSGRLSLVVQPPGSTKRETVRADVHSRSVTLICSREFLRERLAAGATLPDPLAAFLRGDVVRFCHRDAPLPVSMRLVAEELLSRRTDPFAHLMVEAKALELCCLALRSMRTIAAVDAVRPRTRCKVQALRELLASAQGATMTIAQLSRELAWNETQMMEGFRQVTGTTVWAYRQQLRMEQALRQLSGGGRSITEIAFEAGYEHPSNFATAFKRAFGITPRAARNGLN